MRIAYRLSVVTLLLGLAANTAFADYSVTQVDCMTEDYSKQVQRYTEQMAAAEKMGNQDLYAQARDAHKVAQENADACAAFQKQKPAAQ